MTLLEGDLVARNSSRVDSATTVIGPGGFDALVLDLLRTAREGRTVEEIVHELTVLRACRAISMERPTVAMVAGSLARLAAGGLVQADGVLWRWVSLKESVQQGSLF